MDYATQDFQRPGYETQPIPKFPHAPFDWTLESAEQFAQTEGLILTEIHWEVVRALQEFYARHEGTPMHARELHDALDEHFHAQGGIKYLYELFPKGRLAQGCPLAGLQAPPGTQNKGLGARSRLVRIPVR